jgi:thiol:disulfide interchange protein/DsbC/DsbD-like thiol-disulfide interchange protein
MLTSARTYPSTSARLGRYLVHAFALCLLGLGFSGHAQTSVSATSNTPQVQAELTAHAPQGVQAGQVVWVGLQMTHQPEWHTYWRNPGDSGLPTQLEFNLPAGVQAGDIAWPLPHKLQAGNLTNYGFDNTALLAVPLTVSQQFKPSAHNTLDIQLHASWLVCRMECIPQEGDFALSIPVNSSYAPHARAFASALAQQPKTLPSAKVSSHFEGRHLIVQISGLPADLQGKKLEVYPEAPELVASATDEHPEATQSWQGDRWTVQLPLSNLRQGNPTQLGLLLTQGQGDARQGFAIEAPISGAWPEVQDEPAPAPVITLAAPSAANTAGFVLALLGALVGGLILNLMPCVLPVLAIKLLGFAQHSRQHRAHRIAGLAYTVGVVLSFLALGSAVLALRAAGEQLGWGFQLQSPAVVSVLAVLFTVIALNLFGVFEFGQVLPSQLLSFQAKHPVVDALLSGVLAVAVASPCTAPFMGASLGLAMTLPNWQALSIFAAMGLGLAAPYLLASLMPAVAKRLPHPGAWMITLRQLLAFPMLATVVWLLWVLGLQTSLDTAFYLLGGLLLLGAWVWSTRLRSPAARMLTGLLTLALAWGTWQFTHVGLSAAPESARNSAETSQTWQAWSTQNVAQHLAQGQPVFVDFTAAWCVTCQINKKTTLSNATVLADFAANKVALMRADWTRRDPAITQALTALGRSGVPVYVLYAPGQAPVVLSELLSVSQVREALAALPPNLPTTGNAARQ